MRWNIISHITNGAGLQQDYELLRHILESDGHQVHGVDFTAATAPRADRNLWLELVNPDLFHVAKEQWIFPNPEWFFCSWIRLAERLDRPWIPSLIHQRWISFWFRRRFRYILCKTRDCERIFRSVAPETNVVFTGFMARDLYDPSIAKTCSFLHIAGKSQTKNTEAIIEAWREFAIPWKLDIVSKHYTGVSIPNVTFHDRVSDDELRVMMNSHLFHLCPSMYEGYGHMLHEGMGCGAIVITVDRPPMNEFGCPPDLYVKPSEARNHCLATLHVVPAVEIHEAVKRAVALGNEERATLSTQARKTFLKENQEFAPRFSKLAACERSWAQASSEIRQGLECSRGR